MHPHQVRVPRRSDPGSSNDDYQVTAADPAGCYRSRYGGRNAFVGAGGRWDEERADAPAQAELPLNALLFWANRTVQWRGTDALEYRRDAVSPATLEAMFRFAQKHGWRGRTPGELSRSTSGGWQRSPSSAASSARCWLGSGGRRRPRRREPSAWA